MVPPSTVTKCNFLIQYGLLLLAQFSVGLLSGFCLLWVMLGFVHQFIKLFARTIEVNVEVSLQQIQGTADFPFLPWKILFPQLKGVGRD